MNQEERKGKIESYGDGYNQLVSGLEHLQYMQENYDEWVEAGR